MTVWAVPATIRRVIDGDTIVVDLDLGWNTWRLNQSVRLLGCNTPEVRTADHAGTAAKAYTSRVLVDGNGDWYPIEVESHSLDHFGRVLGRIRWYDEDGHWHDLTAELLETGHAVPA